MKNLHLMPMDSLFDDGMVSVLNDHFPLENNVFFHRVQREALQAVPNSFVVPDAFNAAYINEHAAEYHKVILHSLFLSQEQILSLTDEAAKKIVWIVWGHDLYSNSKRPARTIRSSLEEAIHAAKKLIRGTYIREAKRRRKVSDKISLFDCVGIAFPYDEVMLRKKYGQSVHVVYGSEISATKKSDRGKMLREQHLQRRKTKLDDCTNILIGHSGFAFLEHEKYLEKVSHYKSENIHVFMVLSYGADEERINHLTLLAEELIGREKVTVITELMEREDYRTFLSTIDIAIFPYLHQSALGNTKMMAFMGTKLYFHPKGVLAKGFRLGEVKTYDCRKIGHIPFSEFIRYDEVPSVNAPLFVTGNLDYKVEAWRQILS